MSAALLGALGSMGVIVSHAADAAPGVTWRIKKKFALAPPPITADFTLDGAYEIVLIGQDNRIAVLDPSRRKALWDFIIEAEGKIASGAAGHFFSDSSMDLAVVTNTGVVFICNGATGEVRSTHKLGFEPIGPPLVYPRDAQSSESQFLDGLSFISVKGEIVCLSFERQGEPPQVALEMTLPGGYNAIPGVARTAAALPLPHLVAVSSHGHISVISLAGEGARTLSYTIPNASFNECWTAVGDISRDKLDDVVVADGLGYVQAFTVAGETMNPLWDRVSCGTKPISSPIVIDVNNDGSGDILIPKSDREMLLIDGLTGSRGAIWTGSDIYNHDSAIKSPPAVFRAADGAAFAVFSDEKNTVAALDLRTRQIKTIGQTALRFDVTDFSQTDILIAPFTGDDDAQFFALGWREGAGLLINSGLKMNVAGVPWQGAKAGGWRTSSESLWRREYMAGQRKALTRGVTEMVAAGQKAYEAGEWKEAVRLAVGALEANPYHPDAKALYWSAWRRKNLLLLILGGAVSLGALGGIGLLTGRVALRKIWLRQAHRALARGDQAAAAEVMLKVYQAQPSAPNLRSLADLYMALRKYDPASEEIYAKAMNAFPEDDRYLKNLAMAYANNKRRDAAAREVFLRMLKVGSHAGAWAMELGETHQALGEDEDALKAYHEAGRLGHDDTRLPFHLCDLYIKLDVRRVENLPTLLRALPHRLQDKAFLSLFCRTCQEARKHDEPAVRAANALLQLDPEADEAHIILASRNLQEGRTKDAMHHAEAILRKVPNDSIGLRLLGACYAAENRLDGTAMQIFQKALAANPEANEILVAVSKGFIQEGREDSEALQIYQRALKGAPNDETILEQVAHVAGRQSNDMLTIKSCEKLVELGRRSRKTVLQLADAYCRQGVLTDKAEPVYREALLYQADHATVAANLATIYARKGRADAEAMTIYENVYGRDPNRREVGRQLARAYNAAELAEKALKLTQTLLSQDPNDDEMKKIAANAAVALDQLDSAILGYEQVVERNPEDTETLTRLAMLYGKKRRADGKALVVYQRAAKALGDNFDIHSALSRASVAQGDYEQAVTAIKHFLSHAPGQIAAAIPLMEELVEADHLAIPLQWFLIETLTYDGRLRDANKRLTDLLRIDPTQAEVALQAFAKILDKNPKDATALHQRGVIMKDLGRQAEARQALELAHRYRPQDENIIRDLMEIYQDLLSRKESMEIRFQLGRLAMAAGKLDLAISCFQKTDKDYRWENTSVKHLSRCFIQKGMLDLGLQELRRLSMDDEVKELLYELGQRYEAVNDRKGAREVYKMIFAVDISYKDVKGKLETLAASQVDALNAERTAIINALSDQAKNRYELLEELGRGAMGIVYKAQDRELEEIVALKILPETLGNNTDALRRFRQEARNARHLSHPNIVRIHDIGEEAGRKYISMEFVNGFNLKERISETKRQLPFEESLRYTIQIVAAMAAAHEAGIVHRDIKPANIMITREGKVKIADFGIAKAVQDDGALDSTRSGAVVGTPLYMSPEQVQGRNVDTRSDLYSLGVMLYEMVAGMPPFYEGDLAFHHLFTQPKPLENCDPIFANVVMKCLAKEVEQRWQSAREIMAELKKIPAPVSA